MTTLAHTHGTDSSTRRRPPATVIGASALTALIAAVGAYGAIYFTDKEGRDAAGATYEFITLAGLVSAVAFLRGHALGRVGVIVYGIWMTYFTVFKITAIQEWEAIPFGAIALTALFLATRRSARDYTRWTMPEVPIIDQDVGPRVEMTLQPNRHERVPGHRRPARAPPQLAFVGRVRERRRAVSRPSDTLTGSRQGPA